MASFTSDYASFKENSLHGRYITHAHILPLLDRLNSVFELTEIGKSVQGTSIESITFGKGRHKILMWSQMHGNESTTTKAIFDLLNFMNSEDVRGKAIMEECRIKIIPMLNPDGALAYTRTNANQVDLNRDAQELSQPESRVLRSVFDNFKPDFSFNLHDQRTMYNVGDSSNPATVSFLAPSVDVQRSVSATRREGMQLIAAINEHLQKLIPNQIGRYDDGFNSNCVGDTFQMLGSRTVLFEAGHFKNDYERERTRECIFIALRRALITIANGGIGSYSQKDYLKIPENGKRFFDILVRHAHCSDTAYDRGVHLGIRFEEVLIDGTIQFNPKLESVFGEDHYLGHQTFDCSKPAELHKLQNQTFYSDLFGK